ncbi:MAG: efflux RND transporter periplasmic adaptor subunit [Candidatus Pacebacteria bacterium]|nr:efflux RND transporter periplasmic adaptor subunit [Candidatus Paceibacterota bacterium]MBP9851188.1 efflux RND transporter periplasmic adaptor subunit [Candidatus Paceibacterota bacterium]
MLNSLKNLLKKKKVLVLGGVIVAVVLVFVFKNGNGESFSTISPAFGTLTRSVQATGQVVSSTDLDLSFAKSGIVSSVNVKVGDKVRRGQVLASLDSGSDRAAVTKAKASVLGAQAKLKKIIEGSSNEEIALARVNLENAKQDLKNTENTQTTLVKNAYSKLMNSTPEAVPQDSLGAIATAPTISGTYKLGTEGKISISVYSSGNGIMFSVAGLVTGSGSVNSTNPQPLGDSGLYVLFSTTTNLSGTNWVVNLPNKKATDYLANESAYLAAQNTQSAAIASAQSLVNQREAELNIKLASARDSDIELAQADVLSAQGELERAQASYSDNLIIAPENGTITKVETKYGELASTNVSAITLEDIENLYIEADINESNIASIKAGQSVDTTFDAIGKDRIFKGTISQVDPSSVTTEGVVNYKIKVSIGEENFTIRPGMNAEISILIQNIENVISVPNAAIIQSDELIVEDNSVPHVYVPGPQYKKYLNVVTGDKYKKVEVKTGVVGDGNMVEILSGITKEDKIAIVEEK